MSNACPRSLVVGLAFALLLLGCGRQSGGGFSRRTGADNSKTLNLALGTIPTTLDPAKVQDIETNDLLAGIYEALVDYNENNQIVAKLASSWKVSADGKTYTFTLRDAQFHDGSAFTSADVKASWERALSPKLSSPTAGTYLNDILGASEIAAGKATTLTGVTTPDAKTVVVQLDAPRPYFLGKLTYGCARIVPARTGAEEILTEARAIGTGSFKLKTYRPEVSVELAANPDHYSDPPGFERIVRQIIKDPAARVNAYKGGQTDILTLEKQDWKAFRDNPQFKDQLTMVPRPAVYYLLLSGKAYAPFRDPKVRRAFAMAVNRKRIAETIIGGVPTATRWVPPGILEGTPAPLPPFDPAAARAELAKSTWSGRLPKLIFFVRGDNYDTRTIAVTVQNDLKQNLGVNCEIKSMDWGSLLKARNRGEVPFAILSWFGDYLDPQNFLSLLLKSDANANFDKWSNPEFDRLCTAADREADVARRARLYLQAESIVHTEVPRIPLYHGMDGVLISPRISGVQKNLMGLLPPVKVKLK